MLSGNGMALFQINSREKASTITPVVRNPPAGFDWTPPFTITKTGSTFTTNYNIDAQKPATPNTVFVGAGGANTNDGLTFATRVASLKRAVQIANGQVGGTRIIASPGIYLKTSIDNGIPASFDSVIPTVNVTIESSTPGAKVISINNINLPAFVQSGLDSNVYYCNYTTEALFLGATLGLMIADNSVVTAGRPKGLYRIDAGGEDPVGSAESLIVSKLNAKNDLWNMGAYYVDTVGRRVYVRLFNGRAPDSNVYYINYVGTYGYHHSTTSGSLLGWFSDIEWWGCNTAFRVTSNAVATPTVWFKNCGFRFACTAHGLNVTSGNANSFAVGCDTTFTSQDGYNYNPLFNGNIYIVEIGCTSEYQGMSTIVENSCNGTTTHSNCFSVRVNGTYKTCPNRIVHDIFNAQSWLLGCEVGPVNEASAGRTFSAGIVAGLPGSSEANLGLTAQTWIDGCRVFGATYSVQAYGGKMNIAPGCFLSTLNTAADQGGSVQGYIP